MVRKILNRLLKGVFWGSAIFTINTIWLGIADSPAADTFRENITSHAIGFLLFGISLSFSEIILESEKLTSTKKITIYILLLACFVLTIGFIFGWISTDSPLFILMYMLQFALVYFVIWIAQYFYEKHQIEEVNKALQKRDAKE